MSERDQQMLMERIGGGTLQEIAERHDVSFQRVHFVVARQARKQIDDLEMRLACNRHTGDVELFVIPAGPGLDTALSYFRWAMSKLAERDVQVKIHYRPVEGGVVFGVEDVTDYSRGA